MASVVVPKWRGHWASVSADVVSLGSSGSRASSSRVQLHTFEALFSLRRPHRSSDQSPVVLVSHARAFVSPTRWQGVGHVPRGGCTIHPATLTPLACRACECRELVWSPNTPSESREVLSRKRRDVVLVLAMVSAALTGGGTRSWRPGSGSTTHPAILPPSHAKRASVVGRSCLVRQSSSVVVLVSPQASRQCDSTAGSGTRTWRLGGGSTTHPAILPSRASVVGGAALVRWVVGHWSVVSRLLSSIMPSSSVVHCGLRLRLRRRHPPSSSVIRRRPLSSAIVVLCHPPSLSSVIRRCPLSSAVVLCHPPSSSSVVPRRHRHPRCPSSSFGVVWRDH